MAEIRQENIEIGNVIVPVVIEDGVEWYPISYINKHFFERDKVSSKSLKDYVSYLDKKIVDYSFIDNNKSNVQEINCLFRDGVVEWLKNRHIGRMSVKQKKAYNDLCEYFGLDAIEAKARYCFGFDKVRIKLYDEEDQNILNEYFETSKDNQKLQLCTHCNNYLPYSGQFFMGDERRGLETTCWKCKFPDRHFKYKPFRYKEIYDIFGREAYNLYIKNDEDRLYNIYRHYIDNYDTYVENKTLPAPLCSFDKIMSIIQRLYNDGVITDSDLMVTKMKEEYKLDFDIEYTTLDIHEKIFGKECMYYVWQYPCLRLDLDEITIDDARKIFNNYIYINKIKTNNVLDFDYSGVIYKCGLRSFCDKYDTLSFIRDLYYGEYGAYEFNYSSQSHWISKDNRIIALRHFVEKYIRNYGDIPILLSKGFMHNLSYTMNNVLVKYYKNNVFEWVNESYPEYFSEEEYLNKGKFDSLEERQIDLVMKRCLEEKDRLIYNENKVDILGLKPDWFYIGNKGVCVIEYFGLYRPEQKDNSNIISDYVKRHDIKVERYKSMKGYKKLYLYIDDLKNNFAGLKNKIKDLD